MALIIPPEVMDVLNAQAGRLVTLAYEASAEAVDLSGSPSEDDIAFARGVQTTVYAVNAILQSQPLSEGGALLAMAVVSATVLGQCDGDRSALFRMFSKQMSATLAEIAAARMKPVGTA